MLIAYPSDTSILLLDKEETVLEGMIDSVIEIGEYRLWQIVNNWRMWNISTVWVA